jgi:hypothetical protein
LKFLNDPNIDTVDRLSENMSYLSSNRNFVMLIRNELSMRRLTRVQGYQRKQRELIGDFLSRTRTKRIQKQMSIVEGQNKLEGAEYMRLDVPVIIEDTSDDDDDTS